MHFTYSKFLKWYGKIFSSKHSLKGIFLVAFKFFIRFKNIKKIILNHFENKLRFRIFASFQWVIDHLRFVYKIWNQPKVSFNYMVTTTYLYLYLLCYTLPIAAITSKIILILTIPTITDAYECYSNSNQNRSRMVALYPCLSHRCQVVRALKLGLLRYGIQVAAGILNKTLNLYLFMWWALINYV